jgi:putrescine aminotransferase
VWPLFARHAAFVIVSSRCIRYFPVFPRFAMPSPTSPAVLEDLDRRHHLHPFTTHEELYAQGTHIITRGEGSWLWDAHGRKLLDGLAGLWCVNVGYSCHEITDAVNAQMKQIPYYCSFFNSTTEPAIRLADRLASLAPKGMTHVMFSNSGSEANETALKLIRAYHKLRGEPQRTKILSREFAYHGVTLATTSMTGLPGCYKPFDLPWPGFIHVPGPNAYAANAESDPVAYGHWCLEETARIIEREGPETIGAFFAEPIQGAGGVIVPPEGYLTELRELCRKHGILFVADEVITAFGRVGDWFASTLWNLEPDFISVAKGLTSGYLPLGASIVRKEIAEVLVHGGYLAHGYTYSGHPTTCAAALANLHVIERDRLIERTRDDAGPYFQQKLRSFAGHPAVGEVRGHGLIGAIELLPREGKIALAPTTMLGVKGAKLAREEGVIVRGIRDLIAMSPPLIVTHEEIDFLFAAVSKTLDRLWD